MTRYKPTELKIEANNKKLDRLLFKVDLTEVKYGTDIESDIQFKNVPHYKAVVNLDEGSLLSIVTSNYHLLSNKDALEMGKAALVELFPENKIVKEDIVPFSVWHNQKRTACNIDLIYKTDGFLDFKKETWLPFVRVINSYNKQYRLQFQIGFVKSLCSNKIIFEGKTISYSYAHSKGRIPTKLIVRKDLFQKQMSEFLVFLENFSKYNVKSKNVIPHVYRALSIKESDFKDRDKEQIFKNTIAGIWEHYSKDDNSTAHALFNVLTDLTSNFELGNLTGVVRYESAIYNTSLVSNWVKSFANEILRRDYNEDKYLGLNN